MGCIECKEIKHSCIVLSQLARKESQTGVQKTTDSSSPEIQITEKDPPDNSALQMLNEINLARENPEAFSHKISQVLNMIQTVNNTQILIYNDDIQIELSKGREAFESCIFYLNNKNKAMSSLQLIDELKIPFPDYNDLILNREYLSKEIEKKIKEVKGRYEVIDFQYDISCNAQVSTLIQVVDDTSSFLQRRKNILNRNAKYVGISHKQIKKDIMCFYLLFAN